MGKSQQGNQPNWNLLPVKEKRSITATTTDLGNWLNGKLVLYLGDLANPKIGLNLVPNPL
jgi:hypothetical protein